eukprot:scaffold7256_cov118-Skeletonema_marinoi.AAC.1
MEGVEHAMVPRSTTVGNCSLGEWIDSLRALKKKLDTGKNTYLTHAHVHRLDEWQSKYELLKIFFGKEGHSDVPQSNKELGCWVNNQRKQYINGRLSPEKLGKLKFRWVARGFHRVQTSVESRQQLPGNRRSETSEPCRQAVSLPRKNNSSDSGDDSHVDK